MGDGLKRRARDASGRRRARACAFWLMAALGVAIGCRSGGVEPAETHAPDGYGEQSLVPVACGEDQVREYRCDALLPLSSAMPAPEPYGACPGVIEVVDPTYVPLTKTAPFDAVHTEFMRRRAPPGHQCCYSWCGELEVAPVADVPPGSGCNQPLAFAERVCMPEPEGGVSTSRAAAPFDRCAAAVRPPQGAAFSVPNAALLDPNATTQRRGLGFSECCYAWCSVAPPGTGLERGR